MFMEALDAIKEYASVKGSPITKEDIEQYFNRHENSSRGRDRDQGGDAG